MTEIHAMDAVVEKCPIDFMLGTIVQPTFWIRFIKSVQLVNGRSNRKQLCAFMKLCICNTKLIRVLD